jgi:hypothetical protein
MKNEKEIVCKTCKSRFIDKWYNGKRSFCSCSCAAKARVGKKSPRWGGGKITDELGYTKVRVGKKYVREHTLCALKLISHIPKGYVIHHINGIKNDNRIENLQLISRGEHMKLHGIKRK